MSPTSASQTSLRSLRKPSARCGARPAGRARLPAFHCGSRQGDFRRPRLSVRPCFLRTWPEHAILWTANRGEDRMLLHGRYPRRTCPSPVSTSRAGRCAGRMMPKPPGNKGDEPLLAGTATPLPPAVVSGRRPSQRARWRAFYSACRGCQGLSPMARQRVDEAGLSAPPLVCARHQAGRNRANQRMIALRDPLARMCAAICG
jgi:hypothetical protein